ncbi:Basic helix-loop-helix DNA-binding superfamily protein, putative isoform 1 [Capsicum annuum]|nr:Basic helix-loop-helix DNA-binding superfamily protein, putative isoform 1 [Capsicum annuum]
MGLRKLISYNTFNGLKSLNIQSCSCSFGPVEGGSGQFDPLPNLEYLDLHFVKNLKSVSDFGQYLGLRFSKLHQLDISQCASLTCLFNDGGACSVPKHLEEITIRYCRDLVDLFVQCNSSDQATLINSEIPRVRKLTLYDLAELRTLGQPQSGPPYKSNSLWAKWNPSITWQSSPQPKFAVRVGVSNSDTPQSTRPAYNPSRGHNNLYRQNKISNNEFSELVPSLEGDRAIGLGELEHSEECRDFSYCRRFKVEETIYFERCNLDLDMFLGILDLRDEFLIFGAGILEVVQSDDGISVSPKKYMREILNRFKMQNYNSTKIPVEFCLKLTKAGSRKKMDNTFYKQIVGSLMYLTATRLDIIYVVSLEPRILEFSTGREKKADLIGFTDSDYAGDQEGRKSTVAVSWSFKNQTVVTLSSIEAEFVATIACACQVIRLSSILKELQFKMERAIIIFCDNNSSIKLSNNPVNHGRRMHIDVNYYFLRDLNNEGTIELQY